MHGTLLFLPFKSGTSRHYHAKGSSLFYSPDVTHTLSRDFQSRQYSVSEHKSVVYNYPFNIFVLD